jgi:hypothetical protein
LVTIEAVFAAGGLALACLALPASAMPWRPPLSLGRKSQIPTNALHRSAGKGQSLPVPQQLREMAVVEPGIPASKERHHPLSQAFRHPTR